MTVSVNQATAGKSDGSVSLATLLAGEDQERGWLAVADGATQSYVVAPLPNAAGPMPNSAVQLGAVGAVGDYLKSLALNVTTTGNAAVYLRDGSVADLIVGTSGTNPLGTTALALVAATAFTATANQYAGYIVSATYTPTGSAAGVRVKRRIVSHAAVAASTAIALTLTHAIPAGATITAWAIEPLSSYEVVPYTQPAGALVISLGKRSVYGGFKISVDLGVQVDAIGNFT